VVLEDAVGTPCALVVSGHVREGPGEEGPARSDARLRRLAHRVTARGLAGVPVEVTVRRERRVVTSGGGGVFSVVVRVEGCGLRPGLQDVEARPWRPGSRRAVAHAKALVVGPHTPALVVTDVDDTVLVTDVCAPPLAARHTLLTDPAQRTAVPGAAETLTWLAQRGAPVVYLTASQAILRRDIRRFLAARGFPPGVVILRDSLWEPTEAYKVGQVMALSAVAEHLPLFLFGDDAQRDPRVMARVMASRPGPTWGFVRHVPCGRGFPAAGGRITRFESFLDIGQEVRNAWGQAARLPLHAVHGVQEDLRLVGQGAGAVPCPRQLVQVQDATPVRGRVAAAPR
jgi:phosphatidate phosphatase APP1